MQTAPWILAVAAPLDAVRREALQLVGRSRVLRSCFIAREQRVAVGLVLHAAVAFVGAVFFPVLLLLVGPVVLGVPHVAADVRHLCLRRESSARGRRLGLPAAASLLVAAWGSTFVPGWSAAEATRLTLVVANLWLLVFIRRARDAQRAAGSGRQGRLLAVLAVAGGLTAVGWRYPLGFALGFAHAHNLVGLLAVALLVRRSRPLLIGAFALVLALGVWIASGAWVGATLGSPGIQLGASHLLALADGLAPRIDAYRAIAFTTTFAFLQSVHYAVWLFAVPELDRARSGPTTVRTRLGAWVGDFGLPAVLVVVALAALLAISAVVSLRAACATYLAVAAFHGYFELVLLGAWYVRAGGARGVRREAAPACP